MNGKTRERNSTKMTQIVRTGEVLFSTYGIRKVTVEEICREAGVSKVTFYKYFPNKLELFKHIWTGWSDDIYDRLAGMEESGVSFGERMRAVVRYKTELLSKMNRRIIDDIVHAGPDIEEFVRDLRARSMRRFLDFISVAKAKGEMRDIRPELLLAVLDSLTKLVDNDALRALYGNDSVFIGELTDFFFFGIMPDGGCGEER